MLGDPSRGHRPREQLLGGLHETSVGCTTLRPSGSVDGFSVRAAADFLRARAAHGHDDPVLHSGFETSAVETDYAVDVIEVDDVRAMHAQKRWIRQPSLEVADPQAHEMAP